MQIININSAKKYGEGICFEKNEKIIKIGVRIQNKSFFNKMANEIEKQAITQKMVEWWSINGVPIDG